MTRAGCDSVRFQSEPSSDKCLNAHFDGFALVILGKTNESIPQQVLAFGFNVLRFLESDHKIGYPSFQ